MSVFRPADRPFYQCQWKDPVTGKFKTRSTGCAGRREAERFAARLATEIEAGNTVKTKTKWADFRKRVEAELFPGLRPKTRNKLSDTMRLVERVVNPERLISIREHQVSQIETHLWQRSRSAFTVRTHLDVLRRMLKWAVEKKLLGSVPNIILPAEPADPMRGRAVTTEEFERMTAATPAVVGEKRAPEFIRTLNGLWLSGLRIAEAHKFHWEDESEISIDLSGKRPLFRIQGESEKGKTFRLMPMTPDFVKWLLATPKAERHGFVFKPLGQRRGRCSEESLGAIIGKIGKEAKVKVASKDQKTKYASAHDLRRAFGLRWALKVRAPILMKLMRHASITTTLKYYAAVEAQAAAEEVWRVSEKETPPSEREADPSCTWEADA